MIREIHTCVVEAEIRKTNPDELDEQTQYYWVAIAANGEIVARGEEHPYKNGALEAAVRVFGPETTYRDVNYIDGRTWTWKPMWIRRLWNSVTEDDKPTDDVEESNADQ